MRGYLSLAVWVMVNMILGTDAVLRRCVRKKKIIDNNELVIETARVNMSSWV